MQVQPSSSGSIESSNAACWMVATNHASLVSIERLLEAPRLYVIIFFGLNIAAPFGAVVSVK